MKKKILLVDERFEFRMLVKIILSEKYEVDTVECSLQAFALLHDGYSPSLIISNEIIQANNGNTFANQLKSNAKFNQIPVINLACINNKITKTELIKAEAGNYLEEILIKYFITSLIG